MRDPSPPTKETEMLSHPLPKRFTDVASLAIGVNLAVQAVLAGAPFAESLLGGLIAVVGVFLVYTVARTGSFPGASVSARQALRRPATRGVAGATAAAAGVLLLVVGFAPDAEARTRCSYAGPPANTLTVTVSGDAGMGVIRRKGLEITANEFLEPPKSCSGGTPTVLNTDTVSVLLGPVAFA